MAKAGSEIVRQRCRYIESLTPFATEVYEGLSSGKEALSLHYEGEEYRSDRGGKEALLAALRAARGEDLRLGCATVGPHRDELTISINDRPARLYGSQGQQRSAALALKLGEASVLRDFSDELPVALLDDVMSELDPGRQSYILNRIQGWQVFITCCDPVPILRCTEGACFEVEGRDYSARPGGRVNISQFSFSRLLCAMRRKRMLRNSDKRYQRYGKIPRNHHAMRQAIPTCSEDR